MSQKPRLVLETITVWQSSTSCEPLKKLILYTIPKRGLLRQWLQDLQIAITRRQHGFVVPICPGTVQPSLRLKIGSRAKVVAWFHIGDGISYLGLSVKKDPSSNLGQAFDTHHFWTWSSEHTQRADGFMLDFQHRAAGSAYTVGSGTSRYVPSCSQQTTYSYGNMLQFDLPAQQSICN